MVTMVMGRPQEFDYDEVLEKALEVFWEKGYETTSIQDLVDRMGVHRGSIYHTFGDKRALFLKAIDRFGQQRNQWLRDVLDAPGSPLGNIRKFFHFLETPVPAGKFWGCLLTKTAAARFPFDPVVADAVRGQMCRMEVTFHQTLEKAVALGELSENVDTRALASFLTGTFNGLMVMKRAGMSQETMKGAATVALSLLK